MHIQFSHCFGGSGFGRANVVQRIECRWLNENPSVGIILCKDVDKTYVEYMVRTYDKPMGVATFRTADEMREPLRKALPNIEELKKLL